LAEFTFSIGLRAPTDFRSLDHIDDRAFSVRPAGATLDRYGEETFNFDQVCNLGADVLQMVRRDLTHFTASRLARSSKLDNGSHLIRAEAKPSGPANEAESADMALIVDTMPSFGSLRGSEDADPLEISDRLCVHTRAPCQVAPANASGCHVDFP
jgi:hypothetical protein